MMDEKHIAVFIGSYDMPHDGHVRVAAMVSGLEDIDEVLVIPVSGHPVKTMVASYAQRYEMVKLAFEGVVPKAKAHKTDLSAPVEIVRRLEEEHPENSYSLVIGSDLIKFIKDFPDIGEFIDEGHEIIVSTTGDYQTQMPNRFRIVTGDSDKGSSTAIRGMMTNHKDVSGLVPRKVLDYISENGIYSG